jgi:ribonuclease Z
MTLKVTVLGSSSALVTADRDNTSFGVEICNQLILVDCSGNPAGKLLKLGYNPAKLDMILLTHLHVDHCYGLPSIIFHMFLENRKSPLPIYAPKEECNLLIDQLKAHQIYPLARTFEVQIIPVEGECNSLCFKSLDLEIHSIPTSHGRPSRAYRFFSKNDNKSIVLSGDTRPIHEMIEYAAKADLLIHESTYLSEKSQFASSYFHSTAYEAATIAKLAECKALMLVHFALDEGKTVDDYKKEAESVFTGRIIIPNDMDIIEI